ncbi:MAG: molybdopterin molybdotransferase MoeA [Chloroflexi bacterium]|nr:molybdopterin molybdotransferase MoeA [Chloroflexota bacterium]
MRTFDLLTPADAMAKLNAALDVTRGAVPTETIPTMDAYHRVLVRDVQSPIPLPEFRRSTVDGYAVRAGSTPGVLRVVGEVRMGELTGLRIKLGDAALVHTGGNIPEGADAVVMVEQVKLLDSSGLGKIQTQAQLSPGENLIREGEDVQANEVVMRAGARLREQEIGGLLSLGMTQVEVAARPRVALIASGDEVVPPDAQTQPGQVRNINTPMLAALVARNGGVPLDFGILPDKREAFEETARRAMREADVIVFMAGSSVSERDFTPDVVNGMGRPGILVHGIAFRPGKPTLFALCDGKPVFGLPGNPISALVTASLFVVPTLWRWQGCAAPHPNIVPATLAADVKSPRDLEHWFPVKVEKAERLEIGDWRAEPISTKSNLIFGLVRASGLVCVPIGVDYLAAGTQVNVRLFD